MTHDDETGQPRVRRSRLMIHLDTSFLVAALKSGSAQQVLLDAWLLAEEDIKISVVAWAEFLCGPLTATDESLARQMFPAAEAFSIIDAEKAAHLFNRTGRRSRSLADCMIASVAIRCGAKLATTNKGDFQVFVASGLVLA